MTDHGQLIFLVLEYPVNPYAPVDNFNFKFDANLG